jgi:hypothetical protein
MPIEVKGSYIADSAKRLPALSVDDAALDLVSAIQGALIGVWVMVADRTSFPGTPGAQTASALKVARQFLLERVTGCPALHGIGPRALGVIVDHATSREAALMSQFLRDFDNPFTHAGLPAWIEPQALAGASEDWGGIQIADAFAYFAAHHRAKETNVGGTPDVAAAFRNRMWSALTRDVRGRVIGIGYKVW